MRLVHYSKRTESAYVDWIKRFILFHNKRHPHDMGAAEIEGFLTHLAEERTVAASTQNQAFAAILFLYQKVLQIELPNINALRARRPEWLPVVLAVEEVRLVIAELDGSAVDGVGACAQAQAHDDDEIVAGVDGVIESF